MGYLDKLGALSPASLSMDIDWMTRLRPIRRPAPKGVFVNSHTRPSATFGEGRRCPDCITVLSIYNPGPLCRVHTPMIPSSMGGLYKNKTRAA